MDPSGPGSNTYSALTAPASTCLRKAERSGSPDAVRLTGNPRSIAPRTFGASSAGIVNLTLGGCGFSRRRHETATPSSGTPSAPPNRPINASSSSEACADTKNRSAAAPPAAVTRSATFVTAFRQSVGSSVPASVRTSGRCRRVVAFDPAIVEAADVAHPVAVDVGIEPRRHADQLRALGPLRLGLEPRRRVAALLAERADRVDRFGIVPGPRLEAVVARGDRADRADVHQVAGQQRVDALLLERRDLAAVPAIDDVDLRVGVDLAHEPHAPRAEDAAVAVQHQRRPEVDVGPHALAVEHPPRKLHPALVRPEAVGEILQRTLAALVADRAVERMVDQQELEHAGARLDHVGRLRRHDHALGDRRRAGRLQLRHLLDLDDADAAGAVDAEAGVIAVVRDLDAALDRGLQDRSASWAR